MKDDAATLSVARWHRAAASARDTRSLAADSRCQLMPLKLGRLHRGYGDGYQKQNEDWRQAMAASVPGAACASHRGAGAPGPAPWLVLGIGNRLLCDDAVGPLVVDRLLAEGDPPDEALLLDGGTIGLGLLPLVEAARGVIAVDAAAFGAPPGTVRVFTGEAMDRQLGGRKASAHEVALLDLMSAAALAGTLPARRALVAVSPERTAWGLEPTAAVQAAIPALCDAVRTLLAQWAREPAPLAP
jgi:hydrogenase maturation protease